MSESSGETPSVPSSGPARESAASGAEVSEARAARRTTPRRARSPEQTRDDTDEGWGDWRERVDEGHDRWLEEQRPPHWG